MALIPYFWGFQNAVETGSYSDSYISGYFDMCSKTIAHKYVDENNYPFLHEAQTGDVFSAFFKPEEKASNIDILIIEGLGRAFTNSGA